VCLWDCFLGAAHPNHIWREQSASTAVVLCEMGRSNWQVPMTEFIRAHTVNQVNIPTAAADSAAASPDAAKSAHSTRLTLFPFL
jgi:hypothetical protein